MQKKAFLLIATFVLIVLSLLLLFLFVPDQRRQYHPVFKCGANLSKLQLAMMNYCDDHNNVFPNNIEELEGYADPNNSNPFSCPISGKKYVVIPGQTFDVPQYTVLAFCPDKHRLTDESEGLGNDWGLNVILHGAAINPIEMNEVKKLFSEQDIDYDFQE